jgi:Histidine kinase-, DNA gyrase B-, and HSP90-like ATPase
VGAVNLPVLALGGWVPRVGAAEDYASVRPELSPTRFPGWGSSRMICEAQAMQARQSANRSPAEVEIRPGVGMLALLSSMNYKPWYALSEFVDNALASFLANEQALALPPYEQDIVTVTIRFERDSERGRIEIVDDAAGIAAADVARAFRPAEPPPDRTGLSQFGIGMKSAACWYADRFRVSSTALGDPIERSVSFDVPRIVADQVDVLPVRETTSAMETHGTRVVLEDLHRSIPTGRTLGKVRRYLGSIYRAFLRAGTLRLIVGEDEIVAPEPELLVAPRWDAAPKAPSLLWRKDLIVELPSGRVVEGWAGLRARGSTSEAGLALMYRDKVVVGAGAGAGDADDLYRPNDVFGSSNSFVSQRLIGELDVSDLRVSHSKDAVIWDGEEDAFLAALRTELDDEALPLLRMGREYRVTEKGPAVERKLNRAVEATAEAAALHVPPTGPGADEDVAAPPVPEEIVTRAFRLPPLVGGADLDIELSVIVGSGRVWLRVAEKEAGHVIEVDRAHPFMQAFAHLPNQEIEPILRLAAGLGLAEIEARIAGVPDPSAVRVRLNTILRGPLARAALTDPR